METEGSRGRDCGADVATLFCIEIANGFRVAAQSEHDAYLRDLLDAFRIFHFINSPIDRLIANRKQKREQQ